MDIKQAISQARQEFNEPGRLINNGNCEGFAVRVINLMGGYSKELTLEESDWDSEFFGHCFIAYRDRYYDAECPNGVSDWHKLPIFKR